VLRIARTLYRERHWSIDGVVDLNGGVAAWGEPPTPLLPAVFRELLREEPAPDPISTWAGEQLDCGDLDRYIWNHPSETFPREALPQLAELVRQRVGRCRDLRAVPELPPFVELADLPLRVRTRRAVLREHPQHSGSSWPGRATVGDLMTMPKFGLTSLLDLLCVLEAVVDRAEEDRRRALVSGVRSGTSSLAAFMAHQVLAAWAVGEHGASCLRDLRDLADVPRPPEVQRAWVAFWSEPLDAVAARRLNDYSVREQFSALLGSLDARADAILHRRVLPLSRPYATLEGLGLEFHLTKERVRQLELRVLRALTDSASGPLGRRSQALAARLGAALPAASEELEAGLRWATRDVRTAQREVARSVMLFLAGPYKVEHGWMVNLSKRDRLLGSRAALIAAVDHDDIVSFDSVATILDGVGLAPQQHDRWVDHLAAFRRTPRGLLRWDGPVNDKLFRLLKLRGTPANMEELLADLGERRDPRSTRSHLAADGRFVRVNVRGDLALSEWGYEPYSTIVEEIAVAIEAGGGGADLGDLFVLMAERFEVAESSVRTHLRAPLFVVDAGTVRLRRSDEPYRVTATVAEARGCFMLSPTSVSSLMTVSADVARGSGRLFPAGAARFLGVTPGSAVRFRVVLGDDRTATVPVAWNATNAFGPTIGSVRQLVLLEGAGPGSLLRLVFDRQAGTVEGDHVGPADGLPSDPWRRLRALTGLAVSAEDPLGVLGEALGVAPSAVLRTLRSRGDDRIADLLPEVAWAPGDADALRT
jgi:hypothetical protein